MVTNQTYCGFNERKTQSKTFRALCLSLFFGFFLFLVVSGSQSQPIWDPRTQLPKVAAAAAAAAASAAAAQ